MLIGRSAEKRGPVASAMMDAGLWQRFVTPDYAFAFQVDGDTLTGKFTVDEGSPHASSNSVDIIIHGVGAYGAFLQQGKDPSVIGAQIMLNLQTVISRKADFDRAETGGAPVASHHSPQFKISPEPSITAGVEATVHALMDTMGRK